MLKPVHRVSFYIYLSMNQATQSFNLRYTFKVLSDC